MNTAAKYKLTGLILLSFLLIGCGDEGGAKATSTGGQIGREARGTSGVNKSADVNQNSNEASNLELKEYDGRIAAVNGVADQAVFQNSVVDFLSPQLKSDEVGTVSADLYSKDTGIAFYGKGIQFTDSNFVWNKNTNDQNVFNTSTSELRIGITDSNVGTEQINQETKETEVVTKIAIHFNQQDKAVDAGALVESYIKGHYVDLIFADSFGKVGMFGHIETLNGELFYVGDLVYKNLKNLDGTASNTAQQKLGGFIVPACSFFNVKQIGSTICR